MKKTYIQPETKAIKIELCKMIAASTEVGINSTDEALDTETNVASRRFGGVWGDDEY